MRLQRENGANLFPVLSDFFDTEKWVSTDKVIRKFQDFLPAHKADKQFIIDAAELSLEKMKLGQEIQQKSITPNVRVLGRIMENVFTECWNDLIILINKKSITIPTLPTESIRNAYKQFSSKSESDFDEVYCNMIVNGYKDAIAMFEKAYQESTDTDISEWIATILPKLHKHLGYSVTVQKECEVIGSYK
jgi:putative membrane protein